MSDRQPEENGYLLKSIASTVEIMRDRMATRDDLERFATRDDLELFATRDDLERFATKDDLERFATKDDLERFATRDDFASLREQAAFLGGQVEYIRDRLESTATKDDIARLDSRIDSLEVKVDRLEVTTTVIKGEVEQVHLRLDGIDKAISSRLDHVESEMSRMRSVLYLLVKDRPDMLRLLGQAPPGGG
jgi:hypothetical protein